MEYNINIVYKKVKNLTIRIKEDGTVNLTIPFGISKGEAMKFVHRKDKWIREKLNIIEGKRSLEDFKLENGNKLMFLGKPYILKVIKSKDNKIILGTKEVKMYVDNVDNFQKKSEILNNWYLEKAKEIFMNKITYYEDILNLKVKTITIRPMKTRWGSCNTHLKKINLNLELIKKEEICIEYVVLHEMAHLVHPNHSKDFWIYVENYMNDYRVIRNKLKISN